MFLSALQHLLVPAGAAPSAEVQVGVWLLLYLLVFGTLGYAVVALVRWALFVQAVVLEACGPAAALRRSAALVRGHWWRVAALLTALVLGQAALSSLVSALLGAPLAGLGGDTLGGLVGGLGFSLTSILYFPVAANALTVLYLRLQAREEFARAVRT